MKPLIRQNSAVYYFSFVGDPSIEKHTYDFADCISRCIQEKFNQLTQHDIRLQRRKL